MNTLSGPQPRQSSLPGYIAPIVAGSPDTLLNVDRGNELIRVARAIHLLQGSGRVRVLHGQSNIRITLVN